MTQLPSHFALEQWPLVIIGTGLAGYQVAKAFRKHNLSKPLVFITQDDGAFYSKPLLSTAFAQEKTPEQLAVFSGDDMAAQLNATLHAYCTVTTIDRTTHTVRYEDKAGREHTLTYDRLVCAWGADKVKPPISGLEHPGVFSVNSLMDYRRLREDFNQQEIRSVAVLGAGLVGCEFANDLCHLGVTVHVIAPEPHPLQTFLPQPMAYLLKKKLEAAGVHWHLEQTVSEIVSTTTGYTLVCSSQETEPSSSDTSDSFQTIHVNRVIAALGIRPQIALANAVGLMTHRGIVVDQYLQTSDPAIYALGDCAEISGQVQQYIAPLLKSAHALGETLAGRKTPVVFPVMPIIVKTPACPLVFVPPPSNIEGHWQYEGSGDDLRALYHDEAGQLRGFVLVGKTVRDKMALAKQMPILSE